VLTFFTFRRDGPASVLRRSGRESREPPRGPRTPVNFGTSVEDGYLACDGGELSFTSSSSLIDTGVSFKNTRADDDVREPLLRQTLASM